MGTYQLKLISLYRRKKQAVKSFLGLLLPHKSLISNNQPELELKILGLLRTLRNFCYKALWALEFFKNADHKIKLSDLTMTFTNIE